MDPEALTVIWLDETKVDEVRVKQVENSNRKT